MKIGLITFSRSRNYGAVLQTYATYNFLKNYSDNVEVIDYIARGWDFRKKNYPFLIKGSKWDKNSFTRFLWKNVILKNQLKQHKLFWNFIKANCQLTKSYYSVDEMSELKNSYDLAVCGSDQIWNPDFATNKIPDGAYFLSFIGENTKKISISSSFGCESLSNENESIIFNYLKEFKSITTREKSGKYILEKMGLNSEIVLDPTLIAGTKVWNEMASNRLVKNKYMLLFQIFPNNNRVEFARKLAKQKNLKLIIVTANPLDKYKIKHRVISLPKVDEWISYFKYADFVITDSFHATAFSVMFNREFLVDSNVSYNTRMKSLLDYLGLQDRMIDIDSYINMNEINYKKVNEKLEYIRNLTIDVLDKSICK